MILAEHEVTTNASKDSIWGLWSDVDKWRLWDRQVSSCKIDGRFELGAKGVINLIGQPNAKFEITEIDTGRMFVTLSNLPLAKLIFHHEINQNRVIHRVVIEGPTSTLFALLIGRKIREGVIESVEALVKLAEKERAVG